MSIIDIIPGLRPLWQLIKIINKKTLNISNFGDFIYATPVLVGIIGLVLLLCFLFSGISVRYYGHQFEIDTIEITVTDKSYKVSRGNGTDIDHRVFTENESFTISIENYPNIKNGNTHTVIVTGYLGDRHITKVLK